MTTINAYSLELLGPLSFVSPKKNVSNLGGVAREDSAEVILSKEIAKLKRFFEKRPKPMKTQEKKWKAILKVSTKSPKQKF